MESYTLTNAVPAFIEYGTQLDLEFLLVIQVILGMFAALREVPVYNLSLFLFGLYAFQNRDSIDPLKQFSMFTGLSIILDITWLLLNDLGLGYVLTIISLILKPLTLVSVFHLLKLRREPFGTYWSSLGPYGGDHHGRYQSLGDPLLDVDEHDAQEVHIPRHDRYPSSIRRYSSHHSHNSHNSYHSHQQQPGQLFQHTPPHYSHGTNSTTSSGDHRGGSGAGTGTMAAGHGGIGGGAGSGNQSGTSYPGSVRSGRTALSSLKGDGVLSDSASGSLRKDEESGYSQTQIQPQAQPPVSTASSFSAGGDVGMAPISPSKGGGASGTNVTTFIIPSSPQGGNGGGDLAASAKEQHDVADDEESDDTSSRTKRKLSRKRGGVSREDYQEF